MKIKEDVKPITLLKTRAAELVSQVNETHRPVIITQNGEPRAVVLDTGTYDAMRDALGLFKLVAQGEEDVRRGRVKSQKDVFLALRRRLKSLKAGHEP